MLCPNGKSIICGSRSQKCRRPAQSFSQCVPSALLLAAATAAARLLRASAVAAAAATFACFCHRRCEAPAAAFTVSFAQQEPPHALAMTAGCVATSLPLPAPCEQATSQVQSNPGDPLGLTFTNAPFLRALPAGVVVPPLPQRNMTQAGGNAGLFRHHCSTPAWLGAAGKPPAARLHCRLLRAAAALLRWGLARSARQLALELQLQGSRAPCLSAACRVEQNQLYSLP